MNLSSRTTKYVCSALCLPRLSGWSRRWPWIAGAGSGSNVATELRSPSTKKGDDAMLASETYPDTEELRGLIYPLRASRQYRRAPAE